jgi:hypothetical protein
MSMVDGWLPDGRHRTAPAPTSALSSRAASWRGLPVSVPGSRVYRKRGSEPGVWEISVVHTSHPCCVLDSQAAVSGPRLRRYLPSMMSGERVLDTCGFIPYRSQTGGWTLNPQRLASSRRKLVPHTYRCVVNAQRGCSAHQVVLTWMAIGVGSMGSITW